MTETTAVRIDLYESSPGVLLDEREVAAALHVSRKTLQYWRGARPRTQLPSHRGRHPLPRR